MFTPLKKRESLLQKNLFKLFLGEARLRESVSLLHWLYLPWALLLHMDNLSASFLGLMSCKEYILIVLMPLAAWLFSLSNCVWNICYVLFHFPIWKQNLNIWKRSFYLYWAALLVSLLSFFWYFWQLTHNCFEPLLWVSLKNYTPLATILHFWLPLTIWLTSFLPIWRTT